MAAGWGHGAGQTGRRCEQPWVGAVWLLSVCACAHTVLKGFYMLSILAGVQGSGRSVASCTQGVGMEGHRL